MPYGGYSLMGDGEAVFACYEACLPNQVTGQGKQIITDVLAVKDDTSGMRVVENSVRYSLKKWFEIIADFGMRSVVDGSIAYPFWENAARITEDKSALLLAFLLSVSKVVAVRTAMSQLAQTVRSNLSHTAMLNGRLELGSGFDFYQDGVTTFTVRLPAS